MKHLIFRERRSVLKLKLTQQDKELNMHSQGAAAVLVNTATRAGVSDFRVAGREYISAKSPLLFYVCIFSFSMDFVCLHIPFIIGLISLVPL